MAVAMLPLTAVAEGEDTTISFAIPAEWESWYDDYSVNNYYYDYVRINFQKADESWDQITMDRAYFDGGYGSYERYTTWSSGNNGRPVYTANFNRAEVMGDTIKQIQFQIVGYNYETSESNVVLRSYDYNTGSDLSVSDLNDKIFINGLGPFDYSIKSMTVYSVIPRMRRSTVTPESR